MQAARGDAMSDELEDIVARLAGDNSVMTPFKEFVQGMSSLLFVVTVFSHSFFVFFLFFVY